MKRKMILFLLIFLVSFEVGCVNNKGNLITHDSDKSIVKTENNQPKAQNSAVNNKGNSNQNNLKNAEGAGYEVTEDTYRNKNITINYPKIINLSDSKKQSEINSLIKYETMKVLNYYPDEEKELNLQVNFNVIWMSANLLSIQYSGVGYVKDAAHPNNLFYTTNIDMNRGQKLSITDLIKIDENFINKLKNSEYIPQQADPDHALKEAVMTNLKGLSSEDLYKRLKNSDSLDNIGTVNQSDTFSYLTKDSLGISLNVPDALGGHAEFEIKLSDIKANLNMKNEALKDLGIT